MFLAIDQLTTVASVSPVNFSPQNGLFAADLYYHLVLRFDAAALSAEQETGLIKYINCFIRKKGGSVTAVSFAKNRVHLLVGLSQFSALGTFVRELKLVSAAFARRRGGAADFAWHDRYDAFTVSLSQIERVCSYIRRQKLLEREESYASSWNRLASQELY